MGKIKEWSCLLLLCALLCGAGCINAAAQARKNKKRPKPPAKKIVVVSPSAAQPAAKLSTSFELLQEVNAVRVNPASYIPYLEDWKQYYAGENLNSANNRGINTTEGVAAVDEAIAFLKTVKPLAALRSAKGLDAAANVHLNDLQQTGKLDNIGSDGSSPNERVERFGTFSGAVSQIIGQGRLSPREVIISLIIGDGEPTRGNRKRLFSPLFKTVGASHADSVDHGGFFVIVLAENFTDAK